MTCTTRDSKLYIAVLDTVPSNMVPVLVAHTILRFDERLRQPACGEAYLMYMDWKRNSFKKCVVSVNQKQYNKILEQGLYYVEGFENKTLDGINSCVIVEPVWSDDIPNVLKYAQLWKP